TLGILQHSPDGKEWVRIVGRQGKAGDRLAAGLHVADVAALDRLYQQPQGFSDVTLGEDATRKFMSWSTVKNWNWLMYGVGDQSAFLQKSREHLLMQLLLMLVGTLLISVL